MTRDEAHHRLRGVRNRLAAARFAVRNALDMWEVSHGAMERNDRGTLTRSALAATGDDLDLTYVVRLVAAFEGILKDYRENGLKKKPARVDLEPLINFVARKRKIDPPTLAGAHAVRNYRNEIVHRDLGTARLNFATCASALAKFVAWLPLQW